MRCEAVSEKRKRKKGEAERALLTHLSNLLVDVRAATLLCIFSLCLSLSLFQEEADTRSWSYPLSFNPSSAAFSPPERFL